MPSSPPPSPVQDLAFRWPWRPYQQRVLEAVEAHLADGRLHIVAAPGAGKTTLGLEIFRRLAHPAVVLAPTRIIRDQWIQRLIDFLPPSSPTPLPWTSRSLETPGFFTAITYQALHTRHRNQQDAQENTDEPHDAGASPSPTPEELQDVAATLRAAGVRTLILDEAHHLRAAWWKALTKLIDALDDVTLVALTATPPYDVVGAEWKRYEDLCGPIDEEISVPELVRSGTLCPHQDFVWAVAPSPDEYVSVSAYDERVADVTGALLQDEIFRAAVRGHQWIAAQETDPADILDDPPFAVSLLIFLKTAGLTVPPHLLALFDASQEDLPALTRPWWQRLLHRYLFTPGGWPEADALIDHREALKKRLRALRLLYRRELRLEESREVTARLALSPSKIEACLAIHTLERHVRGLALRQAILTDFIRAGEDERLGAWPVFKKLVTAPDVPGEDIALLTGSLVVLPGARLVRLRQVLGARADTLTTQPMEQVPGYIRLTLPGGGTALVPAFTRLLSEGTLRTLVGTRALLGEGWNAPALNSLIMASYVGSYMLTNQMRGRAIRKSLAEADKVSSIWHLVTVALGTPSGKKDVENLERRFDTFVGVSADGGRIESGMERLDLPYLLRPADLAHWQKIATRRMGALPLVRRHWQEAVGLETTAGVVPAVELRAKRPPTVRPYVFANTLRYLLYTAAAAFMALFSEGLQALRNAENLQDVKWILLLAGVAGLLYASPRLIQAFRVALRHAPVEGTLREIALVVRDALCEAGLIESAKETLWLHAEEWEPGVWSVSLQGGTFYEKSLFSDAFAEVLGPIENPRYLVMRRGYGPWKDKTDYHAVPSKLATNKELAGLFATHWRRRIGPTDLLYTRSAEGRATLLKGRARALSDAFADPVRRRDRWH